MPHTPVGRSSRFSIEMSPLDVEGAEREMFEMLRAALATSFVLVRRLGAGGMGIVYLARDPALKRLVAVKVMSPLLAHDPDARLRFQREAESVAAISHPNVVAVHAVGTMANGVPYLVMQYVDGPTMAERIATEGPLDIESAKEIIGQVAAGLEAAHRKGIVHRDIKAANILWDDASGRALVTDFGIAGVFDRDFDGERLRLTQPGGVPGTPRYMSPEQLLSEPVTQKTDVYSLGLLGYELLTGEGPYRMSSPSQVLVAHLQQAPRPLSSLRNDADPALESLLNACLAKDADDRPSAEDVARRLVHGSSVLLEWPPPGLEELHGAAGRPIDRLVSGAFAISIPMTLVATASPGSPLRPGMPQVLLLPSIAAIGGVAMFLAMVEGAKLLRVAMRAARAGYGWGIIAEVLVDVNREAGALIAGEREFAALTVEQRDQVRRGRVLRAALRVSAAAWSVGAFFIGLPVIARSGVSPTALAAWTLGVPALLMLGAGLVEARERRIVQPVRDKLRKMRAPLDRLTHLAANWKDAFERVTSGLALGQGRVGHVFRRAVAVGAVTAAVAGTALAGYGLISFSVLTELSEQIRMPRFITVQEKAARVERLRYLRPAVDPSITPERAGHALQSLATAGYPGGFSDKLEAPPKYPIATKIPNFELEARPVFPKERFVGNGIRFASRGFTPHQREFLRIFATAPGTEEFSMIAHAGRIDWMGAALRHPMPPDTKTWSLPIPRFSGVKNKAYAQTAAAALAFEAGNHAEAERILRDIVGAGFAMTESATLIENLIGLVVVDIGRRELVTLYELTGRAAEARAISADADPRVEPVASQADPVAMNAEARDAHFMGLIRSKDALPGLRWELASGYLAFRPCNDMRQVLFGPDAEHLERLATLRRELVKTPGDKALMDMIDRTLESPLAPEPMLRRLSWPSRVTMGFARGVDVLTGSNRMQTCSVLTSNLMH